MFKKESGLGGWHVRSGKVVGGKVKAEGGRGALGVGEVEDRISARKHSLQAHRA